MVELAWTVMVQAFFGSFGREVYIGIPENEIPYVILLVATNIIDAVIHRDSRI
jgi:hypothetical protein